MKLIAATDAGRELAERCCHDRAWLGTALDALAPEERDAVHAALSLLLRD